MQLLNYMQLYGELSAKHQNNSLVRKAEWTSLPSLADAKKWASKGLRHLCRLHSQALAPSAALLPQPVFLPFCIASLTGSKKDLAPWKGGVEVPVPHS